jgi:hypothetical protein
VKNLRSPGRFQAPASVDREFLFGNMVDVVELSQRMLNCFETNVVGKPFSDQIVGKHMER